MYIYFTYILHIFQFTEQLLSGEMRSVAFRDLCICIYTVYIYTVYIDIATIFTCVLLSNGGEKRSGESSPRRAAAESRLLRRVIIENK